jgi:hypothetical protein
MAASVATENRDYTISIANWTDKPIGVFFGYAAKASIRAELSRLYNRERSVRIIKFASEFGKGPINCVRITN